MKYGLENLPDTYVAPRDHSLNSIAVSLKRIADALERIKLGSQAPEGEG